MTATDELRRMLDERGVGCVTDDGEYVKRTTWHGVGDKRATFVEYVNGECRVSMDDYNFTPEQSIAATLGHSLNNPSMSETLSERGTCEMHRDKYGVWHCSSCEKGADKITGSDGNLCYYCPFDDCDERLRNMGAYPSVYDKMLEWLRSNAE